MAATHLPDLISLTPIGGASPLYLDRMNIRGIVAGNNCLTEVILTFKNETGCTLEGELSFPLPHSGVISGFGYEIDGRMVGGVVVEKETARVAFENEVRSAGKAALVEHVAGNAFKTRIYPIRPNTPISVKVVYLSDVDIGSDGSSFSLPLAISRPLSSLKLHLEIRGCSPVVRDGDEGLSTLKFTATGNDYATDVELQQFKSKKNLLIGLNVPAKVETLALASTYQSEGFFLVHDVPAEATQASAGNAVPITKSVAVVWDASLSMEAVSKKRVLKVLGDLYALPALQSATTQLIVFRQTTEPAVSCANGQELLAKLNAVDYDGGTDMANLRWLGGNADFKRTCEKGHSLSVQKPTYDGGARWNCDGCEFAKAQEVESHHCKECGYDLCSTCFSEPPSGVVSTPFDKIVLVTDGFSNLSEDLPSQIPSSPVFVLNIGTQSNALPLTYIANKTGGQFLDLTRIPSDEHIVQAIASSSKFSFLSATYDAKEFADVLPSQPVPILPGEKFTCSGKLLKGSGTVTLNYGVGGKVTVSRKVNISANQSEDGLIAKIWAGMKVKELSVFAEKNKAELLNVARKYGIVTPGASILVLSDVAAYLKYGIEPSAMALPSVHSEYIKLKAAKEDAARTQLESKLNSVLSMWTSRKGWYEQDFSEELKARHRSNWEATNRAENPKLFEHDSAPPILPPAPGPHTPSMTDAEADAKVNANPPTNPNPSKVARLEKRSAVPISLPSMGDYEPLAIRSQSAMFGAPAPKMEMSLDCMSAAPAMERMQCSARPCDDGAEMCKENGIECDEDCAVLGIASSEKREKRASKDNDDDGQSASGIAIKEWSPDMPYLRSIKAQARTEQYKEYIKERKSYRASPAFYLDVSSYFFSESELKQYGHRVLTSIADLGLEDPCLLRIVGYKLTNEGFLRQAAAVFQRVCRLRENEPQSWRDLGNVYADMRQYKRALKCYNKVLLGQWDYTYNEIELTVLMEANRVIDLVQRRKLAVPLVIDKRLVYNMPCDVRISCGWDTNQTDVDLHICEPDGTECYYGNDRTPTGGLVSRDFTQGYGPEEYMIKIGLPGKYKVTVRYYASHGQSLTGGTTVLLNVYTDFARGEYERCQKTTVRLQTSCDNFEVATIEFAPSGPRKAHLRGLDELWNKELEQRAAWIEAWAAYEKRQLEIEKWESQEAEIISANEGCLSSAKQRYVVRHYSA